MVSRWGWARESGKRESMTPTANAPPRKALVVNNYTPLNLGDAAILQGLTTTLRSAGYGHVTVATMYPEVDWSGLGADAVVPSLFRVRSRSRLRQLLDLCLSLLKALAGLTLITRSPAVLAYRDADLIVSAGGGYLGARRILTNLLAGLNVAYGRLMAKPRIAAPMSIRPCSALVGFILRRTFSGVHVFARDRLSQRIFEAAGIHADVSSDLAFRAPSLAGAARRSDGRTIGWAPRDFARDHTIEWSDEDAAAALRKLIEADFRVVLITQCTAPSADDRPAVKRVAALLPKATVLAPARTLSEARDQYASVDVLIASRMHAAIGALRAGVPALAVAYEEKVTGLFDDLGLSSWVINRSDDLAARLISMIGEKPSITCDWRTFDAAVSSPAGARRRPVANRR